jgi:two-component system, cell cycle response regulator DivK
VSDHCRSPSTGVSARGGSASSDRETILLVDDHVDSREMYALMLEPHGYRVLHAANHRDALAAVAAEPPHAVVTDIGRGAEDGCELIVALRAVPATSAVPVLVVTGWVDPKRIARAHAAGCTKVLLKPCAPDVMLAELREALTSGREGAAV